MSWDVEYTHELGEWWSYLTESEQDDIAAMAALLMEKGPQLPFPYSSGIEGSTHSHMRELRVQSGGRPIRIFYAFDPRVRRSCSSAAIRRGMIASTKR